MSFASFVTRVFGKRPVWLYRIVVPGGATYHMTSRGRNFTTGADKPDTDYPAGQLFTKTAILNGGVNRTTQSERAEVEITLPTIHDLAQAVLEYDRPADLEVTIWQTFDGDPDEEYALKFSGRVVRIMPGYFITKLICEEGFTAMRRSSVAQVIQRLCRHAHYHTSDDGGGCRLELDDWLQTMDITAVTGRTVTVPAAALQPDGTFTAGILIWGGTERFIEAHSGSLLTLETEPVGLAAALLGGDEPADIAPGCNLVPETCLGTFDNIANFGGFWWMTETPFDGRSIA